MQLQAPMISQDKPTVECPKCKSLLANDDAARYGKRVECPKCGTTLTLPSLRSNAGWSEQQLLAEIHRELLKSNRTLHTIWVLAVIGLISIVLSIFV